MIPVLFEKNEQQYRSYGLGPIHDMINPEVTRERNGQYSLYFQYPQDAEFSSVFDEDMKIKSDAGVRTPWQTFEISRVLRRQGELIEVFAKHISQSLLKDALNPSVTVRQATAEQALIAWNNNRVGDESFDVQSDITTTNSTTWGIDNVSNAFEALAGVRGSILDVWGGEYEFDNKTIRLHREMGRKAATSLEYGRNITGMEQEELEDNVYTSIYPYATYIPDGETGEQRDPEVVTLSEIYIDGKYIDMHSRRKIQVVDFSGEFDLDDIPTESRLRELAEQYADANEIGMPHENLTVEYIDLSKTLDYEDFQTMEEVELNDTLPIFYPKFGVTNNNAKVVVVRYNPVKEENISIELGVIGQSFRAITTSGVNERLDRVEQQQTETQSYIVNSAGNRIWFTIPPENIEHKPGDTWFEENGPYTRVRVWNGSQWETKIDTEDVDKIAKEVDKAQAEAENARRQADEAVDSINTAVANAGFTSLDDTLQNMNYITMNAEQNAQQAITNASNAYGLAKTSISEAQTAQANSLTALGKADNALDGVSNLDIRVDDVEAELELKADNTFMTEDGTLTTLSNAITFNANRFSTDMSRIESRVESLAGEINLVILRNAFENTYLTGGEVYPNATVHTRSDTMREMIEVVEGEQLALSKNTTDTGYNWWTYNYYDDNYNFIGQSGTDLNQYILTVPTGVTKLWVSYPTDSQPQIVRGTEFIPYRPNLADQMTSEEINIFRNQYDEFADRTERRLTAVDSSGGRLDVAENLITQTANGLTLKADQSTVDTLAGTVSSLGAEFDVVAGQVSSKVWMSDIDDIEVGGRNYWVIAESSEHYGRTWARGTLYSLENSVSSGLIPTKPNEQFNINYPDYSSQTMYWNKSKEYIGSFPGLRMVTPSSGENYSYTNTSGIPMDDTPAYVSYVFRNNFMGDNPDYRVMLVKGNKATDWTPAPEDTDAKIDHIETEWTQTFDTFSQTVSGIDGRVTTNKQTIDGVKTTVSGHGGRLSDVEQTASGLQTTVASKASQTQVTQLATGFNVLATGLSDRKNMIPHWEVGGLVVSDGEDYDSTDRIRTPMIKKKHSGDRRYYFSLDGTQASATYIMRYYADGRHYDTAQYSGRVLLTDSVPYCRITITTGSTTPLNRKYQLELGTVSDYVPYIGDVSSSQVSILEDNINLRVSKGDVLSQINIEAGRALIQSNRLLLDATNTVITGTAWMDGAVIENASIDGAKIQNATIGSAKIASLDVDKLSGNETEFVRSAWNGVDSTLNIDATNGVRSIGTSSGQTEEFSLTNGRMELRSNAQGYDTRVRLDGVGLRFTTDGKSARMRYNGTNIVMDNGSLGMNNNHINSVDWIRLIGQDEYETNIQKHPTATGGALVDSSMLTIGLGIRNSFSSIAQFYGQIDFRRNLHMFNNDIREVNRLALHNSNTHLLSHHREPGGVIVDSTRFTVGIGSIETGFNDRITVTNSQIDLRAHTNMRGNRIDQVARLQLVDTSGYFMHLSSGAAVVDSRMVTIAMGTPSSVDRIADFYGRIDFFKNLNMNSNAINNQSDERLKTNILDRQESSLDRINQFNFVDFEWIKDGRKDFGIIAQQIKKVAPELITEDPDGYLSINNSLMNMMTSHGLQELSLKNLRVTRLAESNEDKVHALQEELSKANRKIKELEEQMTL